MSLPQLIGAYYIQASPDIDSFTLVQITDKAADHLMVQELLHAYLDEGAKKGFRLESDDYVRFEPVTNVVFGVSGLYQDRDEAEHRLHRRLQMALDSKKQNQKKASGPFGQTPAKVHLDHLPADEGMPDERRIYK